MYGENTPMPLEEDERELPVAYGDNPEAVPIYVGQGKPSLTEKIKETFSSLVSYEDQV